MTRKRILMLIGSVCLALVLVVPVIAGCAAPTPTPTPTPTALPPVKIGVIAPLTGVASEYGIRIVYSIKTAVRTINDAGGILGGRMVEILTYDSKGTAEDAVAAAKKAIVVDKVVAITGFNYSHTPLAVKEITEQYGIPFCAGNGGATAITEEGYYGLTKMSAATACQCAPMVRWIEEQGYKTVVFVGEDIPFNREVETVMKNYWERPGSPVTLVDTIWFPYGQTDLTVEMTKAASYKSEVVWDFCWYDASTVQSTLSLYEAGYEGLHCTSAGTLPRHIEQQGEAAEGARWTTQWTPDPSQPGNKEYYDLYTSMWMLEPGWSESLQYVGMISLCMGLDKAGTDSDLKKYADAVHSLDFPTNFGCPFNLSPKGQFEPDSCYLCGVENGEIVILDHLPYLPEDHLPVEVR